MPTGGRLDVLAGYHFYVEIKEAGVLGAFRECSGLGSESQVIEYKASDEKGETRIHKIPGTMKWQDISLKRGVSATDDLWKWRKKIEDGQVDTARSNGSIVLFDQKNGEIARWNFVYGWPTKMSGPQVNANNNEVAIEECVIAHEGLERVK